MNNKEIDLGYIAMASYNPRQSLKPAYLRDKSEQAPDPSETVLTEGRYSITIDYPLSKPYVGLIVAGTKGMTRRKLVEEIIRCYKEIYASEEDPGNIPGMLNRQTSEGPYGIWGHDLGDLMLHTAFVKGTQITISCDS
jgi:hypothetical protein